MTKNATAINYNYRPATYLDKKKRQLANITGTQRRLAAKHDLATRGRIDPNLLADSTEDERCFLGSMDPGFRSGEDLTPVRAREVEIARLTLTQTIHCEVTTIRARYEGKRIVYSVEAENESEFGIVFITHPRWSTRPLTLRQLVRLINTAEARDRNAGDALCHTGLIECSWEREHDGRHTKDEVGDWVHVSSEFYPQLSEAFDRQFERWAAKREWPRDPDEEDDWADDEEQEAVQ